VTGEATSSLERQESFTQMMELALELALRGEAEAEK
jgi:purine-nucleoside phosphorylase